MSMLRKEENHCGDVRDLDFTLINENRIFYEGELLIGL